MYPFLALVVVIVACAWGINKILDVWSNNIETNEKEKYRS